MLRRPELRRQPVEAVIVHHTAGRDTDEIEWKGIRYWHTVGRRLQGLRAFDEIGYSFVIERVAGVAVAIAGRGLHEVGAHSIPFNRRSFGVAFAGNFEISEPDDDILLAGAVNIAGLLAVAGLEPSSSTIRAHGDDWATACPGRLFPMEKLRGLVAELLAGRLPDDETRLA